MLIGRLAASSAALAAGAIALLGCGTADADASDPAGVHTPPAASRTQPAGGHRLNTTLRALPARPSPPPPAAAAPAGPRRSRAAAAGRTNASRSGAVDLPSYWPDFTTTETRRFDYTSPDGSLPPTTSVFQYDAATKSMLYKEFDAAMSWQDTWYYRAAPRYGIAEWRDDYPQTNTVLQKVFGPVKKVVLAVPIGWGDKLDVGGVYRNTPVFAFFRSSPAQLGSGRQTVTLEAVLDDFTTRDGTTYHDVAQFVYRQRWGFGRPAGARYWMAKGVGPVAIQWIGEDPVTHRPIETARIDAVVTSTY